MAYNESPIWRQGEISKELIIWFFHFDIKFDCVLIKPGWFWPTFRRNFFLNLILYIYFKFKRQKWNILDFLQTNFLQMNFIQDDHP